MLLVPAAGPGHPFRADAAAVAGHLLHAEETGWGESPAPNRVDLQDGAMSARSEAGGPWPVWEFDESAPEDLLGYASPTGIQEHLLPTRHLTDENEGEAREVAWAAYDLFASRRIRYGLEAWDASGRGQRIRPPREFLHDKATCLDVAVAYVAVCEAAHLRPYLVLTDGPDGRHALVVVDLASSWLADAPHRPAWSRIPQPPGCSPSAPPSCPAT